MRRITFGLCAYVVLCCLTPCLSAATLEEGVATDVSPSLPEKNLHDYTVGVDDVLDISLLRPETFATVVTVTPDGTVSFPYVGNIYVKGMTLSALQAEIEQALSDGYMKYPVISVSLRELRSRRFYVYGEVIHPGSYPMTDNVSVLRAISIAGGFTKFGSSSRVKVLRAKKDAQGYEMIKVNINDIMSGKTDKDMQLEKGDIVVVTEGVF